MNKFYQIYLIIGFGMASLAMDKSSIGLPEKDAKRLNKALWEAVESGDAPTIDTLLRLGANPVIKNSQGQTPLIVAVLKRKLNVVQALLANNSFEVVNMNDVDGIPALYQAAYSGSAEIVEALLEAGAQKDYDIGEGFGTPLMIAAKRGHLKTVEKLLVYQADVNRELPDGMTAFLAAASEGCNKMLVQLINGGANAKQTNQKGQNALFFFVTQLEYLDTVDNIKTVIKAGEDINKKYKGGKNALMLALETDEGASNYLVRNLLELGANVHHKNDHGQTALDIARARYEAHKDDYMKQLVLEVLETAAKSRP